MRAGPRCALLVLENGKDERRRVSGRCLPAALGRAEHLDEPIGAEERAVGGARFDDAVAEHRDAVAGCNAAVTTALSRLPSPRGRLGSVSRSPRALPSRASSGAGWAADKVSSCRW